MRRAEEGCGWHLQLQERAKPSTNETALKRGDVWWVHLLLGGEKQLSIALRCTQRLETAKRKEEMQTGAFKAAPVHKDAVKASVAEDQVFHRIIG